MKTLYRIFFTFSLLGILIISNAACQKSNWVKRVELSHNVSKWKDYPQMGHRWWIQRDIWASTVGLNFIIGKNVGKNWEIGAGAGLDYNDKQSFTSFPLSGYISYNFSDSPDGHFYTRITGGYGRGFVPGEEDTQLQESLKMNHTSLELGRYIAFKKSNGLSVSVGYRIQKDIHRVESNFGWFSDTQKTTYTRHQICLRTAFVF